MVTTSVRPFLSFSFCLLTYRFQGKRIRVANEKVDSDDEVAKFFDKSADSESPSSSKEPAADTPEKVSVSHFSLLVSCLNSSQVPAKTLTESIATDPDANSMDTMPGEF